jgi:hypothetical protein
MKTVHQPLLLSAIAALSGVAPLLGGIVEDPFHLPCRFVMFARLMCPRSRLQLGGVRSWGWCGRRSSGSVSSPPPCSIEVCKCMDFDPSNILVTDWRGA